MSETPHPPPASRPVLLYLAHLHWDHVWQRPQQLMTRLTRRYTVWYVDPPHVGEHVAAPELGEARVEHGVRVLRPAFPAAQATWPDGYWDCWQRLLPRLLDEAGENTVLWASSPHADTLVERARSRVRLVVYDCMDDLASFKDGTPAMREQEARLMAHSDLVFTGGRSMYEARKDRHPRVYCFPSGVDIAHYRQGAAGAPEPAALAAIPRPRLGYFGVLDERIDWPMLAAVAARRPAWHWVLVGPTAKVEDAELPRAANIHYLGQQPYASLPAFLRGFDVATMPFALNEATRYISPTKTLEYLAGGAWVISSPVPDVVAHYEGVVTIADGADAWVAAIEEALGAGPAEVRARRDRAEPLLAAATWDSIAGRMADLIDTRLGGP